MASVGAARRWDGTAWTTEGHLLVTVAAEAALPGLAVDAEVGQVVFCEAEGTVWVFDGTKHVEVGGSNFTGIDAAVEAKALGIGAFAVATEDLDLAPADFTGWTWQARFGNVAGGATIPAGTIVERTALAEITERSRPAVQNVIEADGVAGDYFIDLDWTLFEEYEINVHTDGALSMQVDTVMSLWGTQTSSFDASSQFRINFTANTWQQIKPGYYGVFRLALPRRSRGGWSMDVNVGQTGGVQEFISASGYLAGANRPTRIGFRIVAGTTLSVIGRLR